MQRNQSISTVLERFSICGCDSPEDALHAFHAALTAAIRPDDLGFPNGLPSYLAVEPHARRVVLDVLSRARCLEHGSTIACSWLTGDGVRLLRFLEHIHDRYEYWAAVSTAALNGEIIADAAPLEQLHQWARRYGLLDEEEE